VAVLFHLQIVVSPFVWGSKQAAAYHPQVASHWSRYEQSAERLDEPCIRTMRYGPNLPNKRGCWALTIEANRNIKYGREARPYEINGKGRDKRLLSSSETPSRQDTRAVDEGGELRAHQQSARQAATPSASAKRPANSIFGAIGSGTRTHAVLDTHARPSHVFAHGS
jgi:hypothetical protein